MVAAARPNQHILLKIAIGAQLLHRRSRAGYELVSVTALPEKIRQARQQNLRRHGFPIGRVHAVEHSEGNPKAQVFNALGPVAFVDD